MSLGDTSFGTQVFVVHEWIYRVPWADCCCVSDQPVFFLPMLFDNTNRSMVVDVRI
jgi:hypothetical protein